jgi:hypothetical protein
MATGDVKPLSPTAATDVGFGEGGMTELTTMFPGVDPAVWGEVKVAFPPNSAIARDGTPATQAAVIPVPPDRLPAPLPPTVDPKLVISIQALGATSFDVPAPATFPNMEGSDFFNARRVALNGSGLALVTPDGGNTLSLYDASDPTRTGTDRFLTAFTLSGSAQGLAVSRGIAYVAEEAGFPEKETDARTRHRRPERQSRGAAGPPLRVLRRTALA